MGRLQIVTRSRWVCNVRTPLTNKTSVFFFVLAGRPITTPRPPSAICRNSLEAGHCPDRQSNQLPLICLYDPCRILQPLSTSRLPMTIIVSLKHQFQKSCASEDPLTFLGGCTFVANRQMKSKHRLFRCYLVWKVEVYSEMEH